MCVQGNGIFDGPHNNSLVNSFKAWKANAVRVPLNEDCWLNINGIDPRYAGQNYIDNIVSYVNMFTNEGFAVILDLHWSAPGSQKADGQQPMPDHDHSYTFWQSVARTFSGNDKVIFELFNEPFPDNNNWNSPEAWRCWRDGGTCNGVNYEVKKKYTTVRSYEGVTWGKVHCVLRLSKSWINSYRTTETCERYNEWWTV